uniref:Cadherin domain protein n=1 Tax=Heterorhabditis bacteriophora TaxID=37862 RepID=A0A1I7XJY0_HETBA
MLYLGVIRTSHVLDREECRKYWLMVEATDETSRPRSAILHVFVRVLDKNDHRPSPLSPVYYSSVKENSPQNHVVVKLEATDGDDIDQELQPLHFRIAKGDPQSFFRIDQNTGISLYYLYNASKLQNCFRVFAIDIDAGKNAQLYYNITDGDSRFSIDGFGSISTNQPLEYDENIYIYIYIYFLLNILINLSLFSGIPNRQPKFIEKNTDGYRIPISDADQIGVTIGKLEAHDPDGDPLWWSIVDGNINEAFSVNADSGLLVLALPIENLPHNLSEIKLKVKVTDGELNDITTVIIELSRSISSRPQFTALHYKTQISEKTAIGTHIYTIKARANSAGLSVKPVVYGIYSTEDTGMDDKLRIEPSTGNVLVMESLDFEVTREIRTIVFARQGSLTSYATLTVSITDDNDNAPKFLQKEYDVRIPIKTAIGSIVITVLAYDSDSGDSGAIKYSIVSGNEMGFFSLDMFSGAIRVAKRLSDEYIESILTIRATDGGKYTLSDMSTVRIQTTIDEEQCIKFSRCDQIKYRQTTLYQQTVKESTPIGSIVLVVSTEPNGQARYNVKQPCSYFDVHPISGAVILKRWLTHERAKSISCSIIARSKEGIEDITKVVLLFCSNKIKVLYFLIQIVLKTSNTNLYAPVFKQQVYNAVIRENSPSGSAVLFPDNSPALVIATDKDSGPNALIGYRILNPNEAYFSVDFVSGAIRTRKPIDYEKVKEWTFYVQASDMGHPVLSTPVPALVIITVIDENDHPPVFSKSLYKTNLVLPSVSGIVILKTKAIDEDTVGKLRYYIKVTAIGAPDGTAVVYSMLNTRDEFLIHSGTGMVALTGIPLDREQEPIINLLIQARTHEFIPQVAQTVISVQIEDINDCRPQFISLPYTAVVSIDAKIGDKIIGIRAIDRDSGVNGMVRYQSSSIPNIFKLNKYDGKITVGGSLLGVDPRVYEFEVEAEDQGNLTLKSMEKVRIEVMDKARPLFSEQLYRATISESTGAGTTVNSFFFWCISWAITLVSMLDREKISDYNLVVMATDVTKDGVNSTTLVNIKVNSTILFVEKHLCTNSHIISYSILSNKSFVLTVRARDGVPPLYYSIGVGHDGKAWPLKIEKETGRIHPRIVLDYHTQAMYRLVVHLLTSMISSIPLVVEDALKRRAFSTLILNVIDENDSAPQFVVSRYTCSISASAKEGDSVLMVSATDDDEGDLVEYTMLAVDRAAAVFRVHPRQGTIIVAGKLEGLVDSSLTFMVKATDLANPPHHSTTEVSISILSADAARLLKFDIRYLKPHRISRLPLRGRVENLLFDNNLIESDDSFHLFASHLLNLHPLPAHTQYLFLFIGFMDNREKFLLKDSGIFGRVRYSLFDSHEAFMIDERSGSITINRPLDREEQDKYVLYVQASDSDPMTPLSSKAIVRVSVADQNDNAPVFEKTRYVLQVSRYILLIVFGETVEITGILTLAKSLDFEKEKQISFIVVATDSGNPPLSTEAIVEIQVLDENDNPPVFAKDSYNADVRENANKGTKVLKVFKHIFFVRAYFFDIVYYSYIYQQIKATDADSEHYGRVGFSLSGEPGPFHIDDDGWITVNGAIDREKVESYHLIVEAHDGGAPSQTARVGLTITINDENDNSPVFEDCNMTAVVQEGVSPGHVLLSIAVSDADGPLFGGPFNLELRGEGSRAFMFDHSNLITATRLDHSKKDRFLLTVVATDKGGRSSDCPLTIFVKEESRHPPRITPLRVSLNTLMGEFRGGIIGTITAKDEDVDDMLRYSLVEGSIVGPLSTPTNPRVHGSKTHLFRVESESGEVWAEHSISAGLHAFNVSVTDGKYATVSFVEVEVMSLEQDAVDHAVCVRLKGMSAEEFFAHYVGTFRTIFAKHLNVLPENVFLLSVQNVPHRTLPFPPRGRRSSDSDIDVLFVVSRGAGRGMLKPDHIYTRLKQDFQSIIDQSDKMKYQLTTEMCTPGVCQRGECRERVSLNDQQQTIVSIGGTAFVAPHHSRTAECLCPEGYGGVRCDIEVNNCSRSPCDPFEMCVPSDESPMGFECLCPPGMAGERCSRPSCSSEGRCLEGILRVLIIYSFIYSTIIFILVDIGSVAKTRQGLRLHNAVMGCRAMAATPCSEAPCQNGATCHVIGSTYRCSCPTRYTGAHCEVDSDPCGSRPCPLGIQCIPFYNDYLCKCPNGFTGKRCETRGYGTVINPFSLLFLIHYFEVEDVCAPQPCGRYGTCIPIPRQHVHNLDLIPSIFSRTSFAEIIVCLAVIILIGIVVIIIIVICKRLRNRSENKKYGEHINVPHMRNPHVLPSINPPPLPPRGFRGGNKLSNLEQAQLTGLPTVQVRPLPMNERLSSSGRGDSRSPSLAGSGKQWKHRAVEYGSAADSLEQSGRCPQDAKTIETLRLFGIRIHEDDDSSVSSGPSRVRPSDRRKCKQALECLNQERYPLADSIQCLPTNDDDIIGNWSGGVDPIGEAVRQERLRLESLTGRVQVGDTVLSPLVNDEDYMTMRPRRAADSTESQKRPLLHYNDCDDGVLGNDGVELSMKIVPPSPPAHKNHFAEESRVYDDPAVDSESRHQINTCADSQLTSNICDIDASESDGISFDDTV